jgi:DNA-binding response OmpR family regulator
VRLLIAHRTSEARAALADAVRRGTDEPVEVIASGNGAEVLESLLQDEPPEVALVDWDLPGIEGPEMCRLVRDFHHGHDTWLVVLAGSAHGDTGEAWRAGADDCLATPAPAADLCACVDRGLRAMRADEYAELLSGRGEDADDFGAGSGGARRHDEGWTDEGESTPRATLDAVRAPEGGANDFFDFGAASLNATADRASDERSSREWARPAPVRTEEPAGAALLQAVLQQP